MIHLKAHYFPWLKLPYPVHEGLSKGTLSELEMKSFSCAQLCRPAVASLEYVPLDTRESGVVGGGGRVARKWRGTCFFLPRYRDIMASLVGSYDED